MKKLFVQLINFGIVGVIATVIDFGVLAFCKEILGLKVLVSSAISFTVSVIFNYILSMLFVFKSGEKNKAKEFSVFVILSLGGLGLNQAIMWLGTTVLSAYYLLVKLVAEVFVPVYNFITRKVFLEKKEPKGAK